MNTANKKFILAVPKGRILEELLPVLKKCGIEPGPDFFNKKSRALSFSTNIDNLDIIRVRAFDVATFVAFGAAQIGIVGRDVIEEFDYSELYAPVDLGIGPCRLSVAIPQEDVNQGTTKSLSHIKIATKYPNLTKKYFERKGIQAECIKLSGAMELAPAVGLSRQIVDLVSTGSTLKANNLLETEKIMDITSRLVVNRTALKTEPDIMNDWIERFRKACKTI